MKQIVSRLPWLTPAKLARRSHVVRTTSEFATDRPGPGRVCRPGQTVQSMRENPPFFAQWPPLVQIAVPAVLLLAVAAAAPLVA